MRRVHQERQLFQGQERSMQALEQDRLRHLNLEESKIRLRERQARDRQRLVSHRRSQAELQWRADEERRRRLMIEEEAFRQRASSYGGHVRLV